MASQENVPAGAESAYPLKSVACFSTLLLPDVNLGDVALGNTKRRQLPGRYIVADPEICHGEPTFRGTRIMVWQVLEMVAEGKAWETIVEEWGGS